MPRVFVKHLQFQSGQPTDERSLRSNVVLRWEWRPAARFAWCGDRIASSGRTAGPPAFAQVFRSLAAPGSNFFSVKASFWLPRSSILGEAVEQTFPTESSKLGRLMLTIGTSCDPDDVPRAAPHSVGADPKLFHVKAGLA
jgi:hypothetical protein